MKFLESRPDLRWNHFPTAKRDRPITQFRGYLIRSRDAGAIAASVASAHMASVIRWYRWVKSRRLISASTPLWRDRIIPVKLTDVHGFERTIAVASSELSIPNRKRGIAKLEDGLLPVSLEERDKILAISSRHSSTEFDLMLRLGFFTGMRIGSICDLKLGTIFDAARVAETTLLRYLHIGPGVRGAPVKTKFGVTGRVIIPTDLLTSVKAYINSERRLKREALARPEHKNIVFLNRFGRPYGSRRNGASPSVNVDMLRLRKAAAAQGYDLTGFKFHRTRATFATSLAQAGVRTVDPAVTWGSVIGLIRDLLLHKDEATSMRYVTFVQQQEVKSYWANEFTAFLFGGKGNMPLGEGSE
ncbi:site-specific integrase [Lysobacter sp. GX 14042]|uniref:site-specific integrase n=1 Tax=Lysobacter sp. GX 14042 TaxID=2907155 RepID=UPI001F413A9E|nr:site-specific integrase [Lysobacter sp. GX 14042]MCE7032421.1 site-specific integrase [Lysobacter sp. GX 14042]